MQSRRSSRGRHGFSSVIILQSIADAGLSQYVSWPLRIGFELLAKLANMDAQILDITPGINPPNLLQQLAMRQNSSGMEGKLLKYIVFSGRKPDLAATHRNDAPHQVD
jgi:hypothetical protein